MKHLNSSKSWTRLAGSALLVGALSGCALMPTVPQNLQSSVANQSATELVNVPFFAQEDYFCGPASLAMVLNHQGANTQPQTLADLVYLPGRQGSLQLEMLAAPRQLGYLAYTLEPNLPALFSALDAGHPSVVLLNLSLQIAPQWHYAVVVGFQPSTNSMILRSGPKEREEIPLATFLKLWERSKNWGFVVLKPEAIPPTFTNAQGYLNAAVALERSHVDKATEAYRQGTKAWPTEPWFHFGLGNIAYGKAEYGEAEQHYRKAVGVYPDMADAWNNLAEALIKLDRKAEARAAINKAIALGGPRLAAYQETASKIKGN
ncbi:MAG TPA: PA2778 family cysteine peptidase [Limnobacter sp.]|nr:PA2778 family cysteine peptidase [Limnobacter sp.]